MPECLICLETTEEALPCEGCRQLFCAGCRGEIRRRCATLRSVDPCVYGAPRCPCVTVEGRPQTCLERPCRHPLDRAAMAGWQEADPVAYREWNTEECLLAIHGSRQRGEEEEEASRRPRCPVCRAEWSQEDEAE